jgi:hypothetical protein
MHYHPIEPILGEVTLMEVEKAIRSFMAATPACFITDRFLHIAFLFPFLCFHILFPHYGSSL